MPLNAEDVAALATALQSLIASPSHSQPTSQVSAVALKLPTFWTSRPEIWFTQVEAQFATRQITSDETKFNYVVAALDNTTAAEVESLLHHPPSTDRYQALKSALIGAFGKTHDQRDAELLTLSGLGDRKPTGLLRYMRSLNADPQTLMRALFLHQLPSEVRRVLASSNTRDLDELAIAADRIMEASSQITQRHPVACPPPGKTPRPRTATTITDSERPPGSVAATDALSHTSYLAHVAAHQREHTRETDPPAAKDHDGGRQTLKKHNDCLGSPHRKTVSRRLRS